MQLQQSNCEYTGWMFIHGELRASEFECFAGISSEAFKDSALWPAQYPEIRREGQMPAKFHFAFSQQKAVEGTSQCLKWGTQAFALITKD
jgi:hypothetical protein